MKDESFTWGDVVRFWESVPPAFQLIAMVLGLFILYALISGKD